MPRQPYDKKTCGQIWRAYQERAPPQNLGAIEWPQAKSGRLTGIKFLSTGVFETIERDDLYEIIKSSGGRVYSGFSKNLDYLLVGRDAGPAKLADAEDHNITTLNEEATHAFLLEKLSGEGNQETPESSSSKEKKVPVKKESKSKQSKAVAKRKNDPNAADTAEPEKKVSKASTSKPSAPKKKAAVAKSNVAVKQEPDNLNNGAHDGSSLSEGEEAAEDSSKKEIVFRDVEIRLKLTEIPTGGRLEQESKKTTKIAAPKIKDEPIDDSDVTEKGDLTIQYVKGKKGRPKKTVASKVEEEPTDEPNLAEDGDLAAKSTKGKRGRPKKTPLAIKTKSEEGSEQNVPSKKTKASKDKGTDSSKSTKTAGGSNFSPRKTRSKTAK